MQNDIPPQLKVEPESETLEDSMPLIEKPKEIRTTMTKITHAYYNDSLVEIEGYTYKNDYKDLKPEEVGIIFTLRDYDNNIIYKKYLNNCTISELQGVDIEKETSLKDYENCGFKGSLNFAEMDMSTKPLKVGDYKVSIDLVVYREEEINFTGDRIWMYKKDFGYSTNITSFSAKVNKTYKLVLSYSFASKSLEIKSNLLSSISPLEEVRRSRLLDNRYTKNFKKIFFQLAYKIFSLMPIKQDHITFASDSRDNISGNFEYIYEKLRKEKHFKVKFYLKESIKINKTISELTQLAHDFATSKYIIIDDFYPLIYPLKIRKKAELIQVWHAVGSFKKFGYSRVGMPGGPSIHSKNHRNYTKVLVSSSNIANDYAEGFGIAVDNILPIGIPRTDMFFDESKKQKIIKNLNEEVPVTKTSKKVILFAPTFRGNGQQSAYYPYELINFKKIYEAFKDEYVFLLKIHPFVQNEPNIPYEYKDFFVDVSNYREINDLLLITDILITDYSSVIFEYALLDKQMIFFSPDVAEYVSTRDFYADFFSFIPGPLAKSTNELISKIKIGDEYAQKRKKFVEYYFDDIDGQATERFIDCLISDFGKIEDEDKKVEIENGKNKSNKNSTEVELTQDGKIIPQWGQKL